MSAWANVPVRRLFRIVNGGTPASGLENWDGGIRWATPADLGPVDGGFIDRTKRAISARGLAQGSSSVPAGSLVLSTRAPIGYVAQTLAQTAFNQGCRGLVPRAQLDVRYFRYQLRALAGTLAGHGLGSTFMELSADALAAIRVQVPPVAAQRAIAGFLDGETARIDALAARKRRLIELLGERAATVIAGGIGSEIGLSALAVPNSVGRHPMVRLGALASVQPGLTLDGGRDLRESPVVRPYLRVANVQDGRVDLAEVKEVEVPLALALRCELRPGDVLLTEGGDPDKLGRGTVWHGEIPGCLHQNHIFAVRPAAALLPEFLALLSRTPYARAYFEATASKTTGIASTSTSKIASFRVPVLPLREQRRAVEETTARLAKITELTRLISRQLDVLAERRQALITAAVTGELAIPAHRPP
jgi:type I restriction enzyme S subunit